MKSKLKIILPLTLLILGGTYKFVLAETPPAPKPKVHGEVYVLGKDFLVNLEGGSFAKLGVAIVIDHGAAVAPEAGGHGAAASKPPEGYGSLPQEALVRDIVTDTLTDAQGAELTRRHGREALKEKILKRVKTLSDVPIHEVLFTDVSVQ
jgi:flagellar FliL protein